MLQPAWGWGQRSGSGIRREHSERQISRLTGCTTSKRSVRPAAWGAGEGREGGQPSELIFGQKQGQENSGPFDFTVSHSHSRLCLKQNQLPPLRFLEMPPVAGQGTGLFCCCMRSKHGSTALQIRATNQIWIPGSKSQILFPGPGKGCKGCYPTGRQPSSDVSLLCAHCFPPLQATPKTSRMLLTDSHWFWISCLWLFTQACSHIQAGRCDRRALRRQQTGVQDMAQTLSPSLFTVQVSGELCAWRVGQTWTVRLRRSHLELPASGVQWLFQMQYGRKRVCGLTEPAPAASAILCLARDNSLFFVCLSSLFL